MSPARTVSSAAALARLAVAALVLAQAGCGYLLPMAALALVVPDGGSRRAGVVLLPAEGADLVLARGPFDNGDTTEGKGVAVVVGQVRLTATRDSTVRSLTLRQTGTLDDARLGPVRLHRDADGDGGLGPGDPQLGAAVTPGADDGALTYSGLGLAVTAGRPVDLLLVTSTPADAPDAATFRLELAAADAVDAVTLVGLEERRVNVLGAPLRTGTKTIGTTGTLTVRPGPAPPPDRTAVAGTTGVPGLQLDLRTSSAEAIRVDRVVARLVGSGDDAADLRLGLWVDADSDGRLSPGVDVALLQGVRPATDGGPAVFDGLALTCPPGSIVRLLVVLDLLSGAPAGATYRPELAGPGDVTGRGLTSLQPIAGVAPPGAGLGVGGATLTASRPTLAVGAGPQNGDRTAAPGATGLLGLQLSLAAGAAEAVIVSGVSVRASGSAADPTDVAAVRLGVDLNGDGVLGAAEPLLAGPLAFAQDDGVVAFSGFARELPAGSGETWVVTVDLTGAAAGGDRLRLALAAPLQAGGKTSGLPAPGGAAGLQGGEVIVAGSLAVSAGPNPPPAQQPLANAADVPALQLRLAAGPGEAVRPTTISVLPAGTGDDAAGIAGVDLHEDLDQDGVVDLGEPLLATGAFPADGAAVALSNAAGLVPGDVVPGTPRTLLLRLRLSGAALQGQTFALSVAPAGIVARGVASGAQVPVGGATVGGATLTARRARLAASTGPQMPAAGDVAPGQTGVPVLQVRLDVGPGEGATLTSVRVRSSGTANDATAVAGVRLYLEGSGPPGAVDGTDTLLGGPLAFPADDGEVTFTPAAGLAAAITTQLLVVYDVAAGATLGGTLAARLEAPAGLAGTGQASGLAAEVPAATVASPARTIATPPSAVVSQQAPVPAGDVFPDQTGREALQLRVRETTGAAALRLTSLALQGSGTGQEPSDIRFVRLYRDVAPLGSLTAADVAVSLAAFFADDGALTFAGLSETVPAGGSLDLLVTLDLAAQAQLQPGETFRLTAPAGGVALQTQPGGAAVTPSGLPQAGGLLTARGPEVDVRAGPQSPTGVLRVRNGRRLAPLLQARLTAGAGGDVTVQRLDVRAAGTADDVAAVGTLVVLEDGARDGLLGADDVELVRVGAPFAADDGLAQVALTRLIPRGTSVDWIVAYDLGPATPALRTLTASVVAVDAGTSPTVGALPVAGRTLEVVGGLTASLGPASPAGVVSPLPAANAPLLHLRLAADAAEAVTVASVTLSASGTASDATAFTAVRLWRDDGDGVFEPGADDALLGASAFAADDGTVTFGALGAALGAGGTLGLWASVDAAAGAAGRTVRLALAANGDVVAAGAASGALSVSGAAVHGRTRTLDWPAGLFLAPSTLSLGGAPVVAVAAADLDRDGDLDLVALRNNRRATVLLGDGAGGFAAGVDWPAAGNLPNMPRRLLAVDVTRDGFPDLVALGGDGLQLLVNDGAASPTTFTAGPVIAGLGSDLVELLLIDLDRDGDLDFVVADAAAPALRARRNDGAGGAAAGTLELLLPSAPVRAAAADVDRDGRVDVVVTDAGGSARLLRGDGTFLAAADADALGATPGHLALVELDRRAHPAAAVALPGASQLVVLRGDAPAALTLAAGPVASAPAPPLATALLGPRSVQAGDWDGDGQPDLAIVHGGAAAGVAARLGDGTTLPPAAGTSSYAAGGAPDEATTGDADRDADPDLLVADGSAVQLLRGDGRTGGGAAAFGPARAVDGVGRLVDAAVADLDVDGDGDLVAVTADGRAEVWLGAPDGATLLAPAPQALVGAAARLAVADLDGDGAPDLVVSFASPDRVDVLAGRRDGTFAAPVSAPLTGDTDPTALALGDLDRDGSVDAAVIESRTRTAQVLRGVGGALSAALAVDRYPVGGDPRDVALVDLNRDGRLDLLVLRAGPAGVEARLHTGAFALGAAILRSLDPGLGAPSSFAAGDLDRDGRLDLVVASADQAQVELLRGNGDGTFGSQGLRAAAPLVAVRLVDVDRDGDLDVVGARAAGGGAVVVLACTAPATFGFAAPAVALAPGSTPVTLAAGDLDGDADLDAVLVSPADRRLHLLPGR